MKKSLSLLLGAAFLLFCASLSCSKPDPLPDQEKEQEQQEDPQEEKPSFDPNAKITLSQEPSYSFSGEGGSVNVIFTSTGYWELQIPEDLDWITPSSLSGKGSDSRQNLKLTAAGNPGGTVRKGKLVLNAGGDSKTISVSQAAAVLVLTAADVPDLDKYYKPQEFNFDMMRSDSKWSWCRSKQSEHFVVFWDIKYGEYGLYGHTKGVDDSSPTTCKNGNMQVDIDDLLAKAEEFYDLNVNRLGFADTGKGLSVLDKYKMEIYLIYQSEWLATGSGYDNHIGALWVNPSTCKPVGSTIGHEIGHCFQYMVFCDYLVRKGKTGNSAITADGRQGPGWRYGYGSNGDGGNAFWEQTAQWQSMQLERYRPEAFSGWYGDFKTSTHLHVLHERPRYANYFLHWWWVEENGGDITFIGRLWNEAQFPEDPVETYMRMMGYDVAQMNDSMWKYAAHMVTFDTAEIREYGKNNIGGPVLAGSYLTRQDDWWAIAASKAPESTGSNVFRIHLPEEGNETREISITLAPNLGIEGCVSGSKGAGWRYGFVTLNSDDTRTYSPIWSQMEEEQHWTVPANASKMWMVVTGAPSEYERHPWVDDSDDKDKKWPWKVRLQGTKPYGK